MKTKFEIGQRVLVPVTIDSITANKEGVILYRVYNDAVWDGFKEDEIIEDERAYAGFTEEQMKAITNQLR